MTGAALGFQFDDSTVYDEKLEDLILMNTFTMYLGILEIKLYWDKKEYYNTDEDFSDE